MSVEPTEKCGFCLETFLEEELIYLSKNLPPDRNILVCNNCSEDYLVWKSRTGGNIHD